MRGSVSRQPRPNPPPIESGFVGQPLGKVFQAEVAPAFVTRRLQVAQMAVTYVRTSVPKLDVDETRPTEDAFLIAYSLRNVNMQIWEDGRPHPKRIIGADHSLIADLNRAQACSTDEGHRTVYFYMPRMAFDEIADDLEAHRMEELRYRTGEPIEDAIISSLAKCLLSTFERPEQANRMFVDHVTFALGAHVAQAYGGLRPGSRPQKGGLAGWQEKRAKEALSASLRGEETLRDVAKQCGLSVSHFSRAFKDTTGAAPHQWLMHRRVDVAKSLLKAGRLSLSDIASECGFANQSHFTRVFSRIAGLSPGAWRRCCGIEEVESWPGDQD